MKRPAKNLSSSLEHGLGMYALAASATGVSLAALGQSAEAKIVYTPTHHLIHNHGRYLLDLNHDGKADFVLWEWSFCNSDFCRSQLLAQPTRGIIGVEGRNVRSSGWGWASAWMKGSLIGIDNNFSAKYMVAVWSNSSSGYGEWANVKNRYLGLSFTIHGLTHYGWARLSVRVPGIGGITATLTGYAYETIPNKPIIAGKTKGPDVITLQPASLGHLAQGASTISAWRKAGSR